MEHWNQIVTAAMMGTDKSPLSAAGLPDELSGAAGMIIDNKSISKEEQFLQLAALLMNFRQSGVSALPDPGIAAEVAPVETLSWCSIQAMQVLKDIVGEDLDTLIHYWLIRCAEKQQLIHPSLIPAMLEQALYNKKWQPLVAACCGKRGEWLSRFNPAWKFSANQTVDDAWQTGTPEQRKQVLREQRASNPQQAITMLQAIWPQEDAGTKQGFLELLDENISETDLPFLELQFTEKSKKVKAEAVRLMLLVPSSSIIKKYENTLKKLVILQKEKTLLGMSSRLKLQYAPTDSIKQEITELALESKCGQPGYSNEEWVYYQLVKAVQPAFWEQYLQQPGEKIIELFQADELGKKMIPALVLSAVANKDNRWGELLFTNAAIVYTEVLPLIPQQKREEYMLQYFEKLPDEMTDMAFQSEKPWSLPLAMKVLTQFATNPYRYQKNMLLKHVMLIPDEVTGMLSSIQPQEDYKGTMWQNTSHFLRRILEYKKEIIQAFNA